MLFRSIFYKALDTVKEKMSKAENEYDIFNKTQRIDSDFDKLVRGVLEN